MSLKRVVVFWCGFLMLSLTHASLNPKDTTICNMSLIIPKRLHTPGSDRTEGNSNINNRSLSAWNWVAHTNTHRIPKVIYEAECGSHHCSYPNHVSQTEMNSVPIYSSMLVLTQDQNNRKCFRVTWQSVAVGCTCVRVKSSP